MSQRAAPAPELGEVPSQPPQESGAAVAAIFAGPRGLLGRRSLWASAGMPEPEARRRPGRASAPKMPCGPEERVCMFACVSRLSERVMKGLQFPACTQQIPAYLASPSRLAGL